MCCREQKWLGRKLKVGHGGTLDPMASGVLVIGLGGGCKALTAFLSGSKTYRATGSFGKAFDTLDCTGTVTEEQAELPPGLEEPAFNQILQERFVGDIMQRPPAFSALRVNGERAYDLARQQKAVELPERPVRIDSIRLLAWDPPEFRMEVVCGGGTYIRSLIDDSARAAGALAAMYGLERTQQGPFTLEDCLQVSDCADLELIAQRLTKAEAKA